MLLRGSGITWSKLDLVSSEAATPNSFSTSIHYSTPWMEISNKNQRHCNWTTIFCKIIICCCLTSLMSWSYGLIVPTQQPKSMLAGRYWTSSARDYWLIRSWILKITHTSKDWITSWPSSGAKSQQVTSLLDLRITWVSIWFLETLATTATTTS